MPEIQAFCRKWNILEFALFGSVLRDDFTPKSDIDVLVTFSPKAKRSGFDIIDMQEELQKIFGRPVDLVEKRVVQQSRNYIRKKYILNSYQVLYAA